MTNPKSEDHAARIYSASFQGLTRRDVPYKLADEVSRILERESFIGPTYQRTQDEQEVVNQVLPYLTNN